MWHCYISSQDRVPDNRWRLYGLRDDELFKWSDRQEPNDERKEVRCNARDR